jgi:hypothetical protein
LGHIVIIFLAMEASILFFLSEFSLKSRWDFFLCDKIQKNCLL